MNYVTKCVCVRVCVCERVCVRESVCRGVRVSTSSICIPLRVNRSMTYPLAIFSCRLSCSKRRYSSDTYTEGTRIRCGVQTDLV